ncbi:MAG: hypothetical protein KDE00_01950 [Rhodobacteraceae bacterium]|nr:hypothetical protein [Paracoccaceae bacterium]
MNATSPRRPFNLLCVAQAGRVGYEAAILAASLRHADPGFAGRLIVLEPLPGGAWPSDPRLPAPLRALLLDLGAEIIPFEARHFGSAYPQGNKIEGLLAAPEGEPFLFLDSDTLITDALSSVPFDVTHPAASMRRENTWPVVELYGPGYGAIWKSLYDRFGLDFTASLDLSQPDEHWERYLYFNAGWFFGACPRAFGQRFLDYALAIRDDGPEEIVCQTLDPWLDQVALPLVIRSFGGGRPGPELSGLDGEVTCHYRALPLLYARESDLVVKVLEEAVAPNPVKKVLKAHEPLKRIVYQKKGEKIRAMFDRANLPTREQVLRNMIKRAGLWMR